VRLASILADCETSLPPQDAAIGDPQKPRLFGESLKWTLFARVRGQRATEGFFHGQPASLGKGLHDRFSTGS